MISPFSFMSKEPTTILVQCTLESRGKAYKVKWGWELDTLAWYRRLVCWEGHKGCPIVIKQKGNCRSESKPRSKCMISYRKYDLSVGLYSGYLIYKAKCERHRDIFLSCLISSLGEMLGKVYWSWKHLYWPGSKAALQSFSHTDF